MRTLFLGDRLTQIVRISFLGASSTKTTISIECHIHIEHPATILVLPSKKENAQLWLSFISFSFFVRAKTSFGYIQINHATVDFFFWPYGKA